MFTLKTTILSFLLFELPFYQRKLPLLAFIWVFLLLWSLIIISSSRDRLLLVLFIFIKMGSHRKPGKATGPWELRTYKLMFILQHHKKKFNPSVKGRTWRGSLPGQSLLLLKAPEDSQQQQWKRSRARSTQTKTFSNLKCSNREDCRGERTWCCFCKFKTL